ncbi:MAG: phosphoadenosine phosphosulfate reductase family protein [Clostridia bacterium]|nr:phosphoadenosine phosphosulfate reductase family protein [Clostridia bacterium]
MLCDIYGLDKLKAMMLTGVRADESVARSEYDDLSIGKKLSGQYSFHPILDWSSSEVYLYIYNNGLVLNEAYAGACSRMFLSMVWSSGLIDPLCESFWENQRESSERHLTQSAQLTPIQTSRSIILPKTNWLQLNCLAMKSV